MSTYFDGGRDVPAKPRNCLSGCFANAFRQLLSTLLITNGLSQSEFGRRVGMKQPGVNAVLNGRHLPPLDNLEYWAAVLRLVDAARDEFILYARLAHCPSEVQSIYRELRLTTTVPLLDARILGKET